MNRNKLWILLRVQMHETFVGTGRGEEKESASSKQKHRRVGRSNFTIALLYAVMIVVASTFIWMIGVAMHELGIGYVTLLIGMVGASVFCLVTSIYQTKELMFGYKDYEMTMALPFPTSTIVACRILILYFWNLLFCACIMGPAGVVYAVLTGAAWYFWPIYIICLLITPLIPSVIATIIGTLIALVASRFQKKGIVGTILSIAFIIVYMLVMMNMDTVIDQLATLGPAISNVLMTSWPPAAWFLQACYDYNMVSFALFVGVSAALFWLFCVIVGKYFVQINSRLAAQSAGVRFEMTAQKATSADKALIRREFRRLFGSSAYFLNTCIGNIMAMFFAVLLACFGTTTVGNVMGIEELGEADLPIDIGPVVAAVFGFFAAISTTTAVSVSLEGDTLWIVKTMPLTSWQILRSKQNMNLILVAVTTVVVGTALCIAFAANPAEWFIYYLVPLSYGVFMTMFGQQVGLKHANLEWTNEAKLLKQGKAVTIATFTGMGLGVLGVVLSVALGPIGSIILCAALLLLAWLSYRKLRTKGVAQFDALSYN